MDESDFTARIAALEKENRILKQKLIRSEANRVMLEEALETHSHALKVRNTELKESRELIRQSEAKYRMLALHDALTGLSNQVMFYELLTQAILRAKKTNSCFAVLYVDLDRFKPINDKWGHAAGNSVLREIASRFRACVRSQDIVARIGGDEFAVLMENIQDPQEAGLMAEHIIKKVTEPIQFEGKTSTIGASIGIGCYPLDGDDVDLLLHNADTAMYSIKKSGRNGYRFYRDLPEASSARHKLRKITK